MKELSALIDEVMKSGEFINMTVFACDDGTSFVSLKRSWTEAYHCTQLADPTALPSEHIRHTLENVLANKSPARLIDTIKTEAEFDDLF